jgi:hypothetical protein
MITVAAAVVTIAAHQQALLRARSDSLQPGYA